MKDFINNCISFIESNGHRVFYAALVLIIGTIVISVLKKIIKKALGKSSVDSTAHRLILQITDILLKFAMLLLAAEALGLKTSSIITVFSAAGIAIVLAIKDSLSNVAGGFLILFSKPFGKGDYIETDSVSGTVDNISLFYTTLKTPDNKTVFIPNGEVSKAKIINYSTEKTRRLDLVFTIGYQDSISKAKEVIRRVAEGSGYMLEEPKPIIAVGEHGAHAISIYCRIWLNSENYWNAYFYMLENVKLAFDEEGISIPYNQLDVHVDK